MGVHLNNKLNWSDNTDMIYRKGQSRLFVLRRLRSFGVQSAPSFALWWSAFIMWSASAADRKRLDKLIRDASSVLRMPLNTDEEVGERRMVAKLPFMLELENYSH